MLQKEEQNWGAVSRLARWDIKGDGPERQGLSSGGSQRSEIED